MILEGNTKGDLEPAPVAAGVELKVSHAHARRQRSLLDTEDMQGGGDKRFELSEGSRLVRPRQQQR